MVPMRGREVCSFPHSEIIKFVIMITYAEYDYRCVKKFASMLYKHNHVILVLRAHDSQITINGGSSGM
jgi:hypothetical protein